MSSFAGQVAVVTGANGGIGRAIALALAGRGAVVWLLARRASVLEEVAAEARKAGGRAWPHPADLCKDEDLGRFVDRLRVESGRADILVHSAGTHALGAIAAAPVAELDALFRANVRTPYALTQRLLPMLCAQRGQIVFVSSNVVQQARAQVGPFAATQHALKAIADTLRAEVNAEGVRVLSVYPGRTATERQATIHAKEGKAYNPERLLQPTDVAAVVVQALAMERTAEVTDVHVRSMQKT